MGLKIVITEPAKLRLKELFFFYKTYMPKAKAQEIRNDILRKTKHLNEFPNKGQIEYLLRNSPFEYRYAIERFVKIIYRIDGNTIYVIDFFDTRQQPSKLKQRNK